MFWKKTSFKNKVNTNDLINKYSLLSKEELVKEKINLQNKVNKSSYKEPNLTGIGTIVITVFLYMITFSTNAVFKQIDLSVTGYLSIIKNNDEFKNTFGNMLKENQGLINDFMLKINKKILAQLMIIIMVFFGVNSILNFLFSSKKNNYIRELDCVNTIIEHYDIMHKDKINKVKNNNTSLGWIFMIIGLKSSYKKIKDKKVK